MGQEQLILASKQVREHASKFPQVDLFPGWERTNTGLRTIITPPEGSMWCDISLNDKQVTVTVTPDGEKHPRYYLDANASGAQLVSSSRPEVDEELLKIIDKELTQLLANLLQMLTIKPVPNKSWYGCIYNGLGTNTKGTFPL